MSPGEDAEASSRSFASGAAKLAWIFGSSRSGSTWLLRMLSDFADVVPIDDPHLGHHLGVWRPIPLAWAAAAEPPELTTLLDLKADEPGYFFAQRHRESWWAPLRTLIESRFEAQARQDELGGPPTYVVKEPGSHAAPLLAELFPSSKLIFLLRDGRDVVDSWISAHQDGAWAIPGGAFAVTAEGRLPLIRWLAAVWAYRSRAVKRAFETRSEQDRLLIRYETLRERTGECLERVCSMLGFDRGVAAQIAERHRFERLSPTERGPHSRARVASPGSWREHLSTREQEALHEALGDALAEFGYESESPRHAVAALPDKLAQLARIR